MIAHREAALIVEEALLRVFDPEVVRQVREDSPLAVLGMVPADAVCLADAVQAAAGAAGLTCSLGDGDLGSVLTVADLVAAVQDRAEREGSVSGA